MKNKRVALALFIGGMLAMSCKSTPTFNVDVETLKKFYEPLRETYENSIYDRARLPGPDISTADPFVFRWNGKYYLYCTTGGGNCSCRVSTDLVNWELVENGKDPTGYCFYGISGVSVPWAPEVTYFDGKFYLITSPSGQGHIIFEADRPEGPFTKVTGNMLECIDGSFFLDNDEKAYCTIANGSGIIVKRFNDDFLTVKEDRIDVLYAGSRVGRWNEGPYITQRYGNYYLTWTGVDCYAPSYRVDYCFNDGSTPIFNAAAFKQMGGHVLLKTGNDFYGLGHSANVLGPDLDSYYITYHNLDLGYNATGSVYAIRRYYNVSRLSFNGAMLVSDNPDRSENFYPARPEFEAEDVEELAQVGNFYLSNTSSTDTFTCEYNYIGDDARFVFSYVDDKNYNYATMSNGGITLNKVSGGNTSKITEVAFNREYDFEDALHTLRINYGEGKLHVYFDNMEKIANFDVNLKGGKCGYLNADPNSIYYTAMSNVGNGTSDSREYQKNQSLANQYDRKLSHLSTNSGLEKISYEAEDINYSGAYNLKLAGKGDIAVYKGYFADEEIDLTIRVPKEMNGKTVGVRINAKDVVKVKIDAGSVNEPEFEYNLGSFKVNPDRNYVSIENVGEEIKFSKLSYKASNSEFEGYEDDLTGATSDLKYADYGRPLFSYDGSGLSSNKEDNCFAYIDEATGVRDISVSADVSIFEEVSDKFVENRKKFNGTLTSDSEILNYRYGAGVALGVENHEYYYGGPNYEACINNMQGIILYINSEEIILKECDYSHTQIIHKEKTRVSLEDFYNLKLERKGNVIKAYVDGELWYSYSTSKFATGGQTGIYSFFTDSLFKNLEINSL